MKDNKARYAVSAEWVSKYNVETFSVNVCAVQEHKKQQTQNPLLKRGNVSKEKQVAW